MLGTVFAHPSGAAHSSDSRAIGFIEITADIEDLESVSAIPRESIGPSPDGRLSHIPSSIRAAGRDESCGVSEETCFLSTPGSTDEGHARSRLPVTGHEKDGDTFGSKWGRGTSAEPPAALEVPKPSSSGPAFFGERRCLSKIERPNATRSSHSAGSSRICFTGKPFRTLPSKTDTLPRQTLNPVEVLGELASVLDRFRSGRSQKVNIGANPGTASTEAQCSEALADLERKGSSGWAATPTCNAFYAPVTNASELPLRRTRRGVVAMVPRSCRSRLVPQCNVAVKPNSRDGEARAQKPRTARHAETGSATARARHTSRRRRIPMPTSPRHRARCFRHEARAAIVAFYIVLSRTAQQWSFGPS